MECNKSFGADGLSVESLRADGYQAIFVGIGLPNPNMIPIFEGLTQAMGFWTSKDFLPIVAGASKPGEFSLEIVIELVLNEGQKYTIWLGAKAIT